MGIREVWHRLTVNFTSKEILLDQVAEQLTGSHGKLTNQLKEQLLQLSPLEVAQVVCQAGDNLSPLFTYELNSFVTKQGIGEQWIKALAKEVREEKKRPAIEAIGILRLNQAAWPLVEVLKTRNESVLLAAAKALSRLTTRKLLPALVEGLKKEEFWLPARVAPIILTEPELAIPLLKGLLQEEELPDNVYVVAVEILKETRRQEVAIILEELFPAFSAKVQQKILEVLSEMGAANTEKLAVSLLEHADWQMRLRAINALQQMDVPDWLELIEPLAQDENEKVRQTVEWLLKSRQRGGIAHG